MRYCGIKFSPRVTKNFFNAESAENAERYLQEISFRKNLRVLSELCVEVFLLNW